MVCACVCVCVRGRYKIFLELYLPNVDPLGMQAIFDKCKWRPTKSLTNSNLDHCKTTQSQCIGQCDRVRGVIAKYLCNNICSSVVRLHAEGHADLQYFKVSSIF